MESLSLLGGFGLGALGLAAGALSGLLGIGGAVVIIPALVFVFGFSQRLAQGTTLLLMVPPIGLLAAYQYYRAGDVDLRAALIIACFFFLGGFVGARLATSVDPRLLRRIFAGFLMILALRMFFD
jgi:uncharacterized membrane protein YfcA